MDILDKKIFNKLKEKEVAPIRCQYIINNALKDDKKIKHFKLSKLVKAVVTSLAGIILATGGVFAATTVYNNIWKEPERVILTNEQINEETVSYFLQYNNGNNRNCKS